VQEVPLAVGGAGQPALPFGRQQLAEPFLRVDGAVVGERVVAVLERVGVDVDDRQTGRGPAQVQQAEVAERLPGELVVLGLAAGPGGRLPRGGP
jgi:hypothetical protein